jgi:hypothetical protein
LKKFWAERWHDCPLFPPSLLIPSKSLTLDLFFRRDCYHWNMSYRKMKRMKVVEKL